MQPPMRYTGEKPVDPLILNIWPLTAGTSSSYSVYEDSGVAVEYQYGVFARTPIKATQMGDTLTVEIEPVEGGYEKMPAKRGFELRLPADWPPVAVTVNGVTVKQAGPTGKNGWSFEGNTLTTVIPVASTSVHNKVTVEIRREAGLTARRGELDGFAGTMTRLRATYDAVNQAYPVVNPPDRLTVAMQTGDRLSYHPEKAEEELGQLHGLLLQSQATIAEIRAGFEVRLEQFAKQLAEEEWRLKGTSIEAEKQSRIKAMARAEKLAMEVGK